MANENTFDETMARVLAMEGGYVNDPSDSGGETNFGISKASYPDLDIRALTRDQALDIYRRDFWHGTRIYSLSDAVAGVTLDLAINMGPKPAIILAQTALRDTGAILTPDGVIGGLTIAASGSASVPRFMAALRWRAVLHYLALVDHSPALRRFRDGWLRRATALA